MKFIEFMCDERSDPVLVSFVTRHDTCGLLYWL